jgi:hypothetical protein
MIFLPLVKAEESQRIVHARAACEEPDKAREILDYETAKPQFAAWSKQFSDATLGKSLGNLRSMHNPRHLAGKIVSLDYNDDEKAIDVAFKVLDPTDWVKVQEGAYTGLSIGGGYLRKWKDPGDPTLTRYTPRIAEISLVDNPCIPSARFLELQKRDGSIEEVPLRGHPHTFGELLPPKSFADLHKAFGYGAAARGFGRKVVAAVEHEKPTGTTHATAMTTTVKPELPRERGSFETRGKKFTGQAEDEVFVPGEIVDHPRGKTFFHQEPPGRRASYTTPRGKHIVSGEEEMERAAPTGELGKAAIAFDESEHPRDHGRFSRRQVIAVAGGTAGGLAGLRYIGRKRGERMLSGDRAIPGWRKMAPEKQAKIRAALDHQHERKMRRLDAELAESRTHIRRLTRADRVQTAGEARGLAGVISGPSFRQRALRLIGRGAKGAAADVLPFIRKAEETDDLRKKIGDTLRQARAAWERGVKPAVANLKVVADAGKLIGGGYLVEDAIARRRERRKALGKAAVAPERDKIRQTLHEFKRGKLRSFRGYNARGKPQRGPRVTDRRQAIAIALSQARRMGKRAAPVSGGSGRLTEKQHQQRIAAAKKRWTETGHPLNDDYFDRKVKEARSSWFGGGRKVAAIERARHQHWSDVADAVDAHKKIRQHIPRHGHLMILMRDGSTVYNPEQFEGDHDVASKPTWIMGAHEAADFKQTYGQAIRDEFGDAAIPARKGGK